MNIVQIGFAKSGNFFLYSILKGILTEAGMWKETFIQRHSRYAEVKDLDLSYSGQADIDAMEITEEGTFFKVSSCFRDPIPDLSRYIETSPLVWTHSKYCSKTGEVLKHFDKVVYICRDVRDVIISSAHFSMTPYYLKYFPLSTYTYGSTTEFFDKNLETLAKRWAIHISGYLTLNNTYWIFYEKLLADFESEFNKLLEYLNIVLSPQSKEKIKAAVSFNNMKKDYPLHVRQGKQQGWVDTLDDEQNECLIRKAGDVLSLLGYPLHRDEIFDPMKLKGPRGMSNFNFLRKLFKRVKRALISESLGYSKKN